MASLAEQARTSAPPTKAKSNVSSTAIARKGTKREQRTEALNGLGQIGQAALSIAKMHADAQAIEMHFPALAVEVAKMADSNEALGKAIDSLSVVGPYTGLLMAALPLVAQLGVNHGMMPAGIAGSLPKEVLVQQHQARAAEAALQMARAQQEAQREAQRVNDEIMRFNEENSNAQEAA